jgi:hypothetical protein
MDYAGIAENAKARLTELLAKRESLDREIMIVTKILEGAQLGAQQPSEWNPSDPKFSLQIVPLAEQEPAKFADKVRLILEKAGVPLLPTEIRARLESMGVEATSPKHLLIHVHKVLERLFENDEVIQVTRDDKTAYKWLTPFERIAKLIGEEITGMGVRTNPALTGVAKPKDSK